MGSPGFDPIDNHAMQTNRLRGKQPVPLTTSTATISGSNTEPSKSRKRPSDGSSATNQPSKKSRTNSAMGPTESEGHSTPKPETQRQLEAASQVCRYLSEGFSTPLLRSHTTISLVDRDRLQLFHANHSVILVSSTIKFSGGDGLEKFIATIIAFQRLSPEQNGILGAFFQKNTDLVRHSHVAADDKVARKENVLVFTGNEPDGKIEVELGEIISRNPGIGRSTVVIGGTSGKWPETNLVVKFSWPGSGRVPETHFLEKACAEAEKTKDNKWAIKHLPRILHARDITFEPGSALKSVAGLFRNPTFVGGAFKYEHRPFRIVIQERLHPLKSLTNVRDIGQVFLDIACSSCVRFSS